ncbi:Hydantoin racemase [Salinisphaera sp. LB1]|nr:Hydantoin racemase [Salinisphaera sp. LB1]
MIEDRLKLAGLSDRLASVHASGLAVLELERDPEVAIEAIVAKALHAVEVDRAEAICVGCGGMAGLTSRVVAQTGVPVIDGVSAAVKLTEGLVAQNLSTSKARTFSEPREKRLVNWPPAL